jgi:DNA polymerase/3'-5' exonuclease PolX
MSNNAPVPFAQAMIIAERLVARLAPFCHRIEIAGSLRRHKPEVRDIELVAIPRMHTDLFGNPLDTSELDDVFDDKPVEFIKRGRKYWQFKLSGKTGHLYTVDLFRNPDPLTFPVNYLIRTGSAEFSHKMVTDKSAGGYKPDKFTVRDARVWCNGVALFLQDEIDIFELWGMSYIEPQERH